MPGIQSLVNTAYRRTRITKPLTVVKLDFEGLPVRVSIKKIKEMTVEQPEATYEVTVDRPKVEKLKLTWAYKYGDGLTVGAPRGQGLYAKTLTIAVCEKLG